MPLPCPSKPQPVRPKALTTTSARSGRLHSPDLPCFVTSDFSMTAFVHTGSIPRMKLIALSHTAGLDEFSREGKWWRSADPAPGLPPCLPQLKRIQRLIISFHPLSSGRPCVSSEGFQERFHFFKRRAWPSLVAFFLFFLFLP